MLRTTRANVDSRMAVVYIEKSRETADGRRPEGARATSPTEKIISLATIRGVFSNQFQHHRPDGRSRRASWRC